MIILGIETSCDETALSLIDADSQTRMNPRPPRRTGHSADGEIIIRVLADKTLSQIELHKEYGGVFPNLAKREHCRNLIPLFRTVLEEAARVDGRCKIKDVSKKDSADLLKTHKVKLKSVLEREPELLEQFLEFIPTIERPSIDAIAVTYGPGLEPCLWTGVNFAKALSLVWDIPVVPVNHMEGHIVSALMKKAETADLRRPNADNRRSKTTNYLLLTTNFPALALLISGGHTELVLVKNWFQYEVIGETRDDAVGEAFDKVARLLGLPYPGGPPLSALAEKARINADTDADKRGYSTSENQRSNQRTSAVSLPRPMIRSGDFDFSFSGIKTAVLYLLKKLNGHGQDMSPISDSPREVGEKSALSPRLQQEIAREFEDAVTEVLVAKTKKAIEHYGARALLIGGGVIANTYIQCAFEELACKYDRTYMPEEDFLYLPPRNLTTDNALMIAVAGFLRLSLKNGSTKAQKRELTAKGNLALDKK